MHNRIILRPYLFSGRGTSAEPSLLHLRVSQPHPNELRIAIGPMMGELHLAI